MFYHLGLEDEASFAAENGTLMHFVFEKFGEAKRDGIEDAPIKSYWYDEILRAYQEGLWMMSKKSLEASKSCETCEFNKYGTCEIADDNINNFQGCPKKDFLDTVELVRKIVEDKSPSSPLNKNIIDVEHKFELKIKHEGEEIPVIGYIDIITELDDETIEIVDWKSGKYTMSYEECSKDPQLLIYNLAVRSEFPSYKNFFITIWYLRSNAMTLSFGKEDFDSTKKALIKYWKLIKGDESPTRRCDRNNGTVYFDHICKYMCKPELCKVHFENFRNNDYTILPPKEDEDEVCKPTPT